jgi:hypothetical protein
MSCATRPIGWFISFIWLCSLTAATQAAAPTVAQMLAFRPHQPGIVCSTPTEAEQSSCKVELVSGAQRGSSGWLLRDPQGRPLRRYFDTNGDRNVDVWSYYQDGVEVYREVSSDYQKAPNEYRWLNAGGSRWGVDYDRDGKIDSWKVISAEEVTQEVLQAIVTKDSARLQALWITDDDMKSLGLSAAEAARLTSLKQQAPAKFQATVAKIMAGDPQLKWERLESSGPQCIPAEQAGTARDLLKYTKAMVLYENAGKHDWISVGELIQVGSAWRLVDAPVPSNSPDAGSEPASTSDPALLALLDELRKLDTTAPHGGADNFGANPAVVTYNSARADIIEKVIAKVKPEDREQWVHQLADCLSAAAQSSAENDNACYKRLVRLEEQTVQSQPGSPLAAFVTFREMSADYQVKMRTNKGGATFTKVQEDWLTRLAKFAQDYPRAEDMPDALLQLGMVSEFVGKEIEAKKWYQQLVSNFGNAKALSDKAAGALRRLELEGKTFELEGSSLGGAPFNVSSLRGKVVIVYYWASWIQQSIGDFARIKDLLSKYQSQGVELVCVNLDNSPPEAKDAESKVSPPGIQLFAPGGLESSLATQYGIMVLPNMFLVGKNGNVVSRSVQVGNLEEEIKKLIK